MAFPLADGFNFTVGPVECFTKLFAVASANARHGSPALGGVTYMKRFMV